MEIPKMKHILGACREEDIHFQVQETTFVLGRETILPTPNAGASTSGPQMSPWRERLFALMSRNAQRPTAFFKIPPNQVIEVGIQVEI
jgi:KUP system potassium uptake protein